MRFLLPLLLCAITTARAATLVAFGDSTTAPRGGLEIYAGLLEQELAYKGEPVTVINSGIGGHTTAMASARFQRDVLAHHPNVLIVQFGINDSAVDVWKTPPATQPRVALADYEKNLRQFATEAKAAGARVIFMTPNLVRWTPRLKEMYGQPPYDPANPDGFNILLRDYAEACRRVAKETGAALIDIYAKYQADQAPDQLLLDGMHPNTRGQRMVADLLEQHLLAADPAFTKRQGVAWTHSGPDVTIHPKATDITHDTPHPVVLGPALARLADGAVMSVYSAPASYAGAPGETYIAGRITRDGGQTWEPERELVRTTDCRSAHPTVFTARGGTLHLFFLGFRKFEWKDGNPTAAARSDLFTSRSKDGGRTWTTPQRIFEGYTGSTNGAGESRDGQLVVPFSHYVTNPGHLNAQTAVSADGGATWRLSNNVDIAGAGDHDGALEPAVLPLKDGRIWMLIRTTRDAFWQSFSTDGGLTWTTPSATQIPSAHAPGHVIRLADGRLELAWNPPSAGRHQLHVALSSDEGATWSPSVTLAKGSQVTYPFLLEPKPGELWLGYMDVEKGWATAPRARHLKFTEQLLLDRLPSRERVEAGRPK
jgi:lysophospholipase L1-like esterase